MGSSSAFPYRDAEPSGAASSPEYVNVTNFPAVQPVSATSLPLPTGAATEASLGTDGASPPTIPGTGIRGWLRSIYDKVASSDATLTRGESALTKLDYDASGNLLYVGKAPTGSATSANVWVLKKLNRSGGQLLDIPTAVNVAWDNRLTVLP